MHALFLGTGVLFGTGVLGTGVLGTGLLFLVLVEGTCGFNYAHSILPIENPCIM
jgi:hypothetical protein